MIEAPDFLRQAMEAAGIDVAAVEAEAAQVDLDAIEREHLLRDQAARDAKLLAQETNRDPDDIGIPEPSQLRLGDPTANRAGARHQSAGDTERAAALGQAPKSGTDRRRVLDHLASTGDTGATDEEISLALEMRLYTAAPRRTELVSAGWVEDSGRRRPTTTGSPAAVWVLTPLARATWRPA
jgi:hypothetical protein